METVCAVIFTLALLRHSYTDFKEMLLYDWLNLALLLTGLARAAYFGGVTEALQGGGVLGFLMLLLYYASRGGMGEGDVKLAAVLGIWLGMERGLAALLLAFVSGGAAGMLLYAGGSVGRRQAIPFGPFLCAGGLAAYFWGTELLSWYWQQFL